MRLSTIKLAGFKSFVDAVTVRLPSNMTAVVGPNGCGKSNVIDAIRWVMGESAAKRLRGDALTDVIFAGSSARKPVGQASVELILDNSDGQVQGEFAQYAEISVKRVVSRDGGSHYFLNGTRCRRRDVADIFLGTGLGPRSYSIIEQGMISQLIEAKPEQLRVHLEEAAGISKYKERRRETRNRICHTEENISRVNDINNEITVQLEKLDKQARAAQKWKRLKAEKKTVKAQLQALDYQAIEQERQRKQQTLEKNHQVVEKQEIAQARNESALDVARQDYESANDAFNQTQSQLYAVGSDLARIEQQIQHTQQLHQRIEQAQQQLNTESDELSQQLEVNQTQRKQLQSALLEDEPVFATLEEHRADLVEKQQQAEQKLAAYRSEWDTFSEQFVTLSRTTEVERTRISHFELQLVEQQQRRSALKDEATYFDHDAEEKLNQLQLTVEQQQAIVETLEASLDACKESLADYGHKEAAIHAEMNHVRDQMQTTKGHLASLQTLQNDALHETGKDTRDWLEAHDLGQSELFGKQLSVEPEWEKAVEVVLSRFLQGFYVDTPVNQLVTGLGSAGKANVVLINGSVCAMETKGTLAEKVTGAGAIETLLASVFPVEDVTQAQAQIVQLKAGQSVITPDGLWLGAGWLQWCTDSSQDKGILTREREISAVQEQLLQLGEQLEQFETQLEETLSNKEQAMENHDDMQKQYQMALQEQSRQEEQYLHLQQRLQTEQERQKKRQSDLQQLDEKIITTEQQLAQSRQKLEQGEVDLAQQEQYRTELKNTQRQLLETREDARLDVEQVSEQAHSLQMQIQSNRTRLQAVEGNMAQIEKKQEQLVIRHQTLAAQHQADTQPVAQLETEQQAQLNKRLLLDKQLVKNRQQLDELSEKVRQLEQTRHVLGEEIQQQRDKVADTRLEVNSLEIQAAQLKQAIEHDGANIDDIMASLPTDTNTAQLKQTLTRLDKKIGYLEPVNLAAIEERDAEAERKAWMDAQLADLTQSLETLQAAINKIDKETRQRFRQTFDEVNQAMGELFTQLFGGGHAYLEMTGDNLLDTGVAILARPPGKRVSHISLLSGGEKAMTAVALVFAIFKLNPAPFCLLDEVDAPLDEANINRFTRMVSQMSDTVQFIFITHNKPTMEAATQLCGVTMQEPGVSRMVQVDLSEATQLSEAG